MTTIPQHVSTRFLDGLEFELSSGITVVYSAEVTPGYATTTNISHAFNADGEDCPIPELTGIEHAALKEYAEEQAYEY